MDNEIESRISQIERRLARTQLLAGILFLIVITNYFPGLRKIGEDLIIIVPLILGGLALTVFLVFGAEKLLTKKKE